MKQLIYTATLILLLGNAVFAQEFNDTDDKRGTIKFAPTGLALGKVTLGGEFSVTDHGSLTLMVGIPFNKTVTVGYAGKKSDVQSKAFSLMAGYRYYLGQNQMRGAYIEPYAKYVKHQGQGLLDAELNGQNITWDNRSEYEGIGAGLQAGVQFLIARQVVFDLFLLGPEVNSAKFSTRSTDITNTMGWTFADADEAEGDVKELLLNIPVIGDKINVTVDTNKKTVFTEYSGILPGFRVGASIGLRF